jgi:hypothetical protein
MATIIHFVGRDQLMVRESEAEVEAAFDGTNSRPIALTHHRSGSTVFDNPALITHWRSRGPRSAAERRLAGVTRIPSLR